MELDPATAAYQKHGYNDRPVEARIGPHRFLIPANYFYDQIGPDFQGNVALSVQWPELQPLPPGKNFHDDMQAFDKAIGIRPDYIDRVSIETLLEAYAGLNSEPGTLEHDDPRDRLDLMRAQPERDGLTPYTVDSAKLAEYGRRYQTALGVSTNTGRETYKDWFVRRDEAGKLQTFIRCDHEPAPGVERRPGCNHNFVLPQLKIAVSIDYAREYLPQWKRIEDRARALLAEYRAE